MISGGRDNATVVLLGLEGHLWDDTDPVEKAAYRTVTLCFMAFLLLALASSIHLVYLIVSSWWLAVPAGIILTVIIGSVVRFSLIILRRSIFDPFLSETEAATPEKEGASDGSSESAAMTNPAQAAPTASSSGSRLPTLAAAWGKALRRRFGSQKPGMDTLIRFLIVSLMGCLVVFPLSALFHHGALESKNESRRSELLARYTRDQRGSLEARTSWIEHRIGELEKDLSMNVGAYRSDGLMLEKTTELERLRKELHTERGSVETDLARLTGQYRERLERSHFLMHGFRAVTGMPAFPPVLLLVGGLLLIPHLLLSRLKKKGEGSYAERSTLHYRTIIDEEYRRTEESGYANLERMYGYKPDQFKKNIHWENTPYNTVPRRIFEDRTPMTRDEFEGATGTIKHSKP